MNDQLFPASLVRYGAQLEAAIQRDLLDGKHPPLRRHLRGRGFAAPLAGVTAAAVAVVVLLSVGPGGASLVDRAYAAINGNGAIVHFVETARTRPDPGNDVAVAQVWIAGKRVRAIITQSGQAAHSVRVERHEVIVNGNRVTTIRDGHRTRIARACAPLLGFCDGAIGNPFSVIKSLYKSGHLRQAGSQMLRGRKVGVIVGTLRGIQWPITVRIYVDPKTAVPVEIVEKGGVTRIVHRGRVVWTVTSAISNYSQLPMTPKNEELLTASK